MVRGPCLGPGQGVIRHGPTGADGEEPRWEIVVSPGVLRVRTRDMAATFLADGDKEYQHQIPPSGSPAT